MKEKAQVVILCGGRGTRLKPVTDAIPKPLIELNGKPILDYIIDFYRMHGFSRILLCLGYKGEKIREHYRKPLKGITLSFADAGEKTSMIKRLWLVRDKVEDTFFVSYGDTLIDLDIQQLRKEHVLRRACATIVSAKIRNPFGLITFDKKGWARSFVEKPLLNYYIGSFVLERSSLRKVPAEFLRLNDGQGLVNFFLSLIRRKKLAVFEHGGLQITFNTEDERKLAEEDIGKFYTLFESRAGQAGSDVKE